MCSGSYTHIGTHTHFPCDCLSGALRRSDCCFSCCANDEKQRSLWLNHFFRVSQWVSRRYQCEPQAQEALVKLWLLSVPLLCLEGLASGYAKLNSSAQTHDPLTPGQAFVKAHLCPSGEVSKGFCQVHPGLRSGLLRSQERRDNCVLFPIPPFFFSSLPSLAHLLL